LRGEAYFVVRHDAKRVFWVLLEGARIEDLGTRFDVIRNAQGHSTVSVLDGIVKIDSPSYRTHSNLFSGAQNPAYIVAGRGQVVEAAAASATSNEFVLSHRDVSSLEHQIDWAQGWVTFDNNSLSSFVREINRHNTRQIHIVDPEIADIRLSGHFKPVDLESIAAALSQVAPIETRVSADGTVYLFHAAAASAGGGGPDPSSIAPTTSDMAH
jgi:transmembrane sensor